MVAGCITGTERGTTFTERGTRRREMAFFQLKEYSRGHINRMQHKPINKKKYLKALFWTQVSTTPHKGAQTALFV